jgi:hypothetical protein
MLDDALEEAQTLAMRLTGPDRGMASVRVYFDPYAAHWLAEASYSDNSRIVSTGSDSPTDEVWELSDLLKEEKRWV